MTLWQSCVRRIEVPLRDRRRSLTLLLAVGTGCLLLAAETSLVGITLSFKTPFVGRLLLAVDSSDPWLQFKLSQVYRDTNPAESIRYLRRATELSPYSRML